MVHHAALKQAWGQSYVLKQALEGLEGSARLACSLHIADGQKPPHVQNAHVLWTLDPAVTFAAIRLLIQRRCNRL